MKIIKYFMLTLMTLVIINISSITANAAELDDEQRKIAEQIEQICEERWEECGVLPSVCIAQAYMESHIGKQCYANNLWGLYGGYRSFDSLDDGINEYIDIISGSGYYDNALWRTNSADVIDAIWYGGYCETSYGQYVGGVNWLIDEFALWKYDIKILENCNKKTSWSCNTWKQIKD